MFSKEEREVMIAALERLTYRTPGDDRMLAALRELNDADKRLEALKAEVDRLNMEVSILRVERDTALTAMIAEIEEVA